MIAYTNDGQIVEIQATRHDKKNAGSLVVCITGPVHL